MAGLNVYPHIGDLLNFADKRQSILKLPNTFKEIHPLKVTCPRYVIKSVL